MKLLALFLVLLLSNASANGTGRWQFVGRPVNTTSGLVIGHPSTNRSMVSEYLGIPYAQPPVSNLRFKPPVALKSTRIYNASAYVCLLIRGLHPITDYYSQCKLTM